jgi:CubicO group peptidase (beta-lactamase class C family)
MRTVVAARPSGPNSATRQPQGLRRQRRPDNPLRPLSDRLPPHTMLACCPRRWQRGGAEYYTRPFRLELILDRRTLLQLAVASPVAAVETHATANSDDEIDAYVRERMRAKGIPGAGIAVIRAGHRLRLAAFGIADLETGRPASLKDVYPMASVSKIMTAIIAMKLVEAGKLDLDAPAARYLPQANSAIPESVLVRHLLSHTSGLISPEENPAYAAELQKRKKAGSFADTRKLEYFTPTEMISYAPKPRTKPSEEWRYNQYPYLLFGLIVANLTGKSFDAFAQEAILDPLGMTSTAYGDHRTLVSNRRPANYTRESGPLQNFMLEYPPSFWPAAGCNSSVPDMAKLLSALKPGGLLSAGSLKTMSERTTLLNGKVIGYGLGVSVDTTAGHTWFGHEGGGCCYAGYWPQEGLGVTVMFNMSATKEDAITSEVAARAGVFPKTG